MPFEGADNVRHDARTGLVILGHKSLAVIDPKALTVKADISVGAVPRAFRPEPSRPRMYCNLPGNVVAVIDTDRNEVTARYTLTLAGNNAAMAVDPEHHRLFIGCRKEPKLVVLDTDTGKEITSLPIPGDVDDLAYDARNKRVYASCGEGFLVAIRQDDPDHYTELTRIPTAKLARTSLLDADSGRMFVAVPRQPGKDGPEVWVFRVR
jgi:DNA-binding beta-propeller fold protein YncE